MINISSGIAILYKGKILLCHPTNASLINSFSIPKGGVNIGESLVDAAIRETREEVGITITKEKIENIDDPIEVLYINKKGQLFKKVYVFVVKIKTLEEINCKSEIIDDSRLQFTEVDWAGFMSSEEASEKIFFRFKPLLNLI
jgi:ADP-ribose pyrophosphatase YjhB (NUDIX family)